MSIELAALWATVLGIIAAILIGIAAILPAGQTRGRLLWGAVAVAGLAVIVAIAGTRWPDETIANPPPPTPPVTPPTTPPPVLTPPGNSFEDKELVLKMSPNERLLAVDLDTGMVTKESNDKADIEIFTGKLRTVNELAFTRPRPDNVNPQSSAENFELCQRTIAANIEPGSAIDVADLQVDDLLCLATREHRYAAILVTGSTPDVHEQPLRLRATAGAVK